MPLPFQRRHGAQLRPSFSRDFAGLKTLDHGVGPAIKFERASNATFFDASGVLQTASNNVPRFDHDPATAGNPSRGLLIEEARTNLLERSAEFDNAYWSKGGITVTANSAVAPDGATSADKMVEDSSTGVHRITVSFSPASTANYTLSLFVKAAEKSLIWIGLRSGTDGATNYASLQVNPSDGSVFGTPIGTTSVSNAGNGWYRIAVTGSVEAGTRSAFIRFLASDNTTTSYTGDGTSGILLWGAQLEQGAFPTSYIPTTSAAATRSADSAVVTPISGFYNQAEGTLFAEYSVLSLPSFSVPSAPFSLGRGLVTNDSIFLTASYQETNRHRVLGYNGTSLETDLYPATAFANGVLAKAALALKTDDFALSIDGATPLADSSGTLSNQFDRLSIGERSGGSGKKNGHIRKIAYWPKRLTNTLLEQLTT